MSSTYKTTGINLKSIPLGENDRLLTILSPDYGVVRAVAPGARKYKSSLRGRSGLFVVNDLLIVRGRSLDRVIQAESLLSFPNLSQDLGKLTAGQYIAEIVMLQALDQHPQDELYKLICDYLARLDCHPTTVTLKHLVQTIYVLLAYAGIAPQVFRCCATQRAIRPDFADPHWRVEFDTTAGGIVSSAPVSSSAPYEDRAEEYAAVVELQHTPASAGSVFQESDYLSVVRSPTSSYRPDSSHGASKQQKTQQKTSENLSNVSGSNRSSSRKMEVTTHLTAAELDALQRIAQTNQDRAMVQSPEPQQIRALTPDRDERPIAHQTWLSIERVLRHYTQYHLDQPIRSAALIETCFWVPPS